MKSKKSLFFKIGAVVLLLAIAALMMVIGRGHTVYFDSKALDYDGQTYETPYKIVVIHKGEQVAKLYDGERGMTTCIGQNFSMTLEITQEKGGEEVTNTYSLKLPYNMDGIIINLPAYLAGLPEEAYLSEFIASVPEAPEDEVPVTDEFAIPEMDTEPAADPAAEPAA